MRRRLRNCNKRLLQISWQKHKAACSWGSKASKRQAFWKIDEAELVLTVWNATKMRGFDIKFQEGHRGDITFEEFLAKVEAVAHPGRSSLFKRHHDRLTSLPLDARRPSISPTVVLWWRWKVVLAVIALAILVLLPVVAGCTTFESALPDRFTLLPPALQTHCSGWVSGCPCSSARRVCAPASAARSC